jgi:hypothetical protein
MKRAARGRKAGASRAGAGGRHADGIIRGHFTTTSMASTRLISVLARTSARRLGWALAVATTLAAPGAHAVTFSNQAYTCPIDGQSFTQSLPVPGQPQGSMLDLKPWGPGYAPVVLPVCPGNRFVVWKRDFTPAEVQKYRELVASPRWLAIRDTETDYYRIARLREWHGDDAVDVAFTLLYATWEVDDTPDRYARYATEALAAIDAAHAALPPDDPRAGTLGLLAVELARRLGHFDAAGGRLKTIEAASGDLDPALRSVIDQQRTLIAARDAAPHRLQAPPAPPTR